MNLRAAVSLTGLSREALLALVDGGRLPAYVVAGRLVLEEADLVALRAENPTALD